MPIKGLTNRGASFAQIGNIRKGAKVTKNGVERPVDLKYFRVEFDDLETERSERFGRVYGDQPTEINILIPFDEIDRCWDAWCEAYTAGRMVARSDGEYFTYLVDLTSGSIVVQNGLDGSGNKVPHRTDIGVAGKSKIQCKPVGRLKVIVPELQSAAYLVLHTTSWHDIRNISEQLDGIKMLNNGRLVGIPMVLRRRPKKISIPKPDGTRARMEKWLISIEADPQWVAAMIGQLQQAALPVAVINPGLPEPEAKEEDEDISEAIFDEDDDEEYWNGIEESGDPDPEPPALTEAAQELGGDVVSSAAWTNEKVTIETAMTEQSSDGTKYWDMPSDKLAVRVNSINASLKKNHLDEDAKAERELKRDVIQAILQHRQGA